MELKALKTWYTQRDGWVTLEDDVLSIVRQVRDLYGDRITVQVEPTTGDYVFVEHCEDGDQRLIFTSPYLDGRCLERLLKGDSQSRSYEDPYDAAEAEQDRIQQGIDNQYREYIGEAGAHLAHAMKHSGLAPRLPLAKSMYVPGKVEKQMEREA